MNALITPRTYRSLVNWSFFSLLGCCLFLAGCTSDTPEPAKPRGLSITAGERDPEPKGLVFKILSPTQNQVINLPKGTGSVDVQVKFKIEGWELSPKGHNIHFILDDEMEKSHYVTKPYILKNIKKGTHVIRAFPTRPSHESVKLPEAFQMVVFHVGRPSMGGKLPPNPTRPLLTYSQPSGDYAGPHAERILLDFWLNSCKLGPGKDDYRALLTIDGESFELTTWKPHWIEGLEPGEHLFVLQLIKPGGRSDRGTYNRTERRINILP